MAHTAISSVREPKIEPADTIFVAKKTIINTTSPMPISIGASAKNTPAPVATPLPPLKPRKTVYV